MSGHYDHGKVFNADHATTSRSMSKVSPQRHGEPGGGVTGSISEMPAKNIDWTGVVHNRLDAARAVIKAKKGK